MSTSNYPAIGGLCMQRRPLDARLTTVYKVKAVRGSVSTSAGVLVPPSPTVIVENVKTKECESYTLAKFNETFTSVVH